MDIKTLALALYPYWLMGAFMIWMTAKSKHKELVRIDKKALLKFGKFLAIVTVYRFFLFKMFPNFSMFKDAAKNISIIPWPMTLTVFWEDACHGLPLLLLRNLIGTKKWTWPIHGLIMGMMMLEFGLGHVYQGVIPAMLLSLYIPYSIRLGKEFGFGTVMIGHTLFDLTTILSMKYLLGG